MIKTNSQVSVFIKIQQIHLKLDVTDEIGCFILQSTLEELKFTGRVFYRYDFLPPHEIHIGVSLGFTDAALLKSGINGWVKDFCEMIKEKAEENVDIDSDFIFFQSMSGPLDTEQLAKLKYPGDMSRYKRGLTIYSFCLPHQN